MTEATHSTKILLVLDLDETLIHSCETPLETEADFRVSKFYVYKRPYLEEFLSACSEWFELAVWSSASDNYVHQIVHEIFPNPKQLEFVWGASRTTTRRTQIDHYQEYGGSIGEYHDEKRLRKLKRFGWSIERILIVDDSPEKCKQNYGNAIYSKAFFGEQGDNELKYLASYLETLKDCKNVRSIEKRRWRDSVDVKQR